VTAPATGRSRPTKKPKRTNQPLPTGAPRRIAVYVRRSTDDEHQPFSIDAQLAKLNSYIDSQPGWTLVATFSDDASGATTERPGLQAALNAAHAGRYDVLLVYRVDRFSRRLTDMMSLVEQLDTAEVAFCSATEHFDTSTPMGRMFLQLLGMFAEFERSTIIDRVINGLTAKAGKGKWTGGTRPYGYLVDQDRLSPHPQEAPVLREIFGLYVTARLGTRTIANQLNTRGLRNRTGKPWSGHNIGRLLANRVYRGEVHFRDVVATDAHPALIDETTFAAAQRLRAARGDKQTQRAGSDSDYHCTGLITCPRCGHKYVGTSARGKTRRYRYYTCFSRTRYGAAGCPAGRIDADDLDTAVLTSIANTFTSRTDLLTEVVTRARQHHHDSHAHRRAELATVEAEIASARAAIDRYLTAFENGTMNDTTCAPRIAALEIKIIQLEARHAELIDILSAEPTTPSPDVLNALRRRIRDVIAAGTPVQRKELIEAMVAEIRIDGGTVYPIFRLPQDDESLADTISTREQEPPLRTMVRSVGRAGLEPATEGL
jgi:site-specific DNA recombinase